MTNTDPESSDLGRFEPTPYDLGITDDPEATWADVRLAEPEAEAEPDPDAEAEADWADEWDSADSHAYMDRVEAGLEPEAEADPDPEVGGWPGWSDREPEAEADADGPVVFFVLERNGVPQGIGGPYRAEPDPEAEPEPEAEP